MALGRCEDLVPISVAHGGTILTIPGQIEAPQVIESIRSVPALCKKAGKPCGVFAATPEKASTDAAQGFEFIGVGMDTTVLLEAYKSIGGRLS